VFVFTLLLLPAVFPPLVLSPGLLILLSTVFPTALPVLLSTAGGGVTTFSSTTTVLVFTATFFAASSTV